ncbi:hypothetical protein [Clostridium gasigenes]|uniref:Uncharacterized protein n=1 Tax=Clostridium gasigenes TaxID=94869 RepID=A0A1H0N3X6_9CLOT|nr:hypothetical protein [Clostridium gasigenes]SDO87419.1 hypothetical protein SAMN04488529_101680 [Clostridium gasigenes]
MKCNHEGADGESAVVDNKCGMCGIVVPIDLEEKLQAQMSELKEYIDKIELQKDRYIEENKALREVVRNLSKVI